MINFKPLELNDRDIFSKYLGEYSFNTYEYTFFTLYFWRKMCHTELGIVDNTMIIKKSNPGTGFYFMQPVGYSKETLKEVILKLKYYKQNNPGFSSLLADIEAPFLEELKAVFGESIVFREDADNFDYIYDSQQLISLTGNKYHRKKNQYNQFVSGYSCEIRDLSSPVVRKDCIRFARTWYETKSDRSEQLAIELNGIEDALTHAEHLNVLGMAVYVNNDVAGFAFGEKANDKMAIVHIEKGNLAYHGIYSFINKTLTERYFGDTVYINRQEDLGIEGLRKAKMAYLPVSFERKYIVDLV